MLSGLASRLLQRERSTGDAENMKRWQSVDINIVAMSQRDTRLMPLFHAIVGLLASMHFTSPADCYARHIRIATHPASHTLCAAVAHTCGGVRICFSALRLPTVHLFAEQSKGSVKAVRDRSRRDSSEIARARLDPFSRLLMGEQSERPGPGHGEVVGLHGLQGMAFPSIVFPFSS